MSVSTLRFSQQQAIRQKRKRFFFSLLLFMIASLLIFGVWQFMLFFTIQTVECVLDSQPCPQELVAHSEKMIGKSILNVSIQSVPVDYELELKKSYPHNLKLLYRRANTLVQVCVDDTCSQGSQISEDGTVIATISGEKKIPIIIDAWSATQSSRTAIESWRMDWYRKLVQILGEKKHPLPHLVRVIDKNTIYWEIEKSTRAIVDVTDTQAQLNSLQLLLSDPTITLDSKEVDLRFELPVMRDLGG